MPLDFMNIVCVHNNSSLLAAAWVDGEIASVSNRIVVVSSLLKWPNGGSAPYWPIIVLIYDHEPLKDLQGGAGKVGGGGVTTEPLDVKLKGLRCPLIGPLASSLRCVHPANLE